MKSRSTPHSDGSTESDNALTKAAELIQESEFKLRMLFNSAHDAIFTMDNKTFVDCNEATLRIFQCTREQIVGQTPYRFSPQFQPDGRTSEEAAMEKIMAALNGQPQFFEWKHTRYDGTPFDAEVSLNRLDLKDEIQIQAIVRDVSDRKKAERENERLALVANETTNMVIITDGEGKIEWTNPSFTRLTGYELSEVVGKTPGSFLQGPESDPDVIALMRKKLRAGKGFKDIEIINYTKDGKPYWTSFEVQPIRDKAGKVTQFVAIQTDISERKAHQQALLDRNEELSKLNAELDRFVYSASHDLRAPIASLLGLIEVAKMETNPDNMGALLDMQKKSLLRLDHFIKDIVDHSRNTRLLVESELINFESIINLAFEHFQFMDNADKVRKIISVELDGPFYTSASRLEIILNNLISNALKYADFHKPDPFIEVQVKANSQKATLHIKDNGEGIPEEGRPKIFEMFYRASSRGMGSGLGLYIVKEALLKIDGTIQVLSALGKGTEFIIEIPNKQKLGVY
jgi:PAS domain S-box-containing protein